MKRSVKKVFLILLLAGLGQFLSLPAAVSAFSLSDCAGVIFEANLKQGAFGQEIRCLQIILNLDPKTKIAKEGDGSPGKETSQFGKLTTSALIRFQEKYVAEILKPANLKSGNGFVGPLTRKKLNQLLSKALGNKNLKVVSSTQGQASYYGSYFQGKKTASGQIFDKNKYTAAHLTLPFGTRARVVNVKNKRSVVVKINDRGPYVKNRIIDLSEIAGRDLGMIGPGIARVEVHVLK